jgi:Tol biopolymer transport system component
VTALPLVLGLACFLLLGLSFAVRGVGGVLGFSQSPPLPTQRSLYLINADGTGLRRLTHGAGTESGPTWSAAGILAVVRTRADGEVPQIWAVGPDTGVVRQLAAQGREPAWSPDGRWLAYTAPSALGPPDLFVLPAAGGDGKDLTAGIAENLKSDPVWSPRGDRIACLAGARGLWVLGADGSHPMRLPGADDGSVLSDLAWSPEGGRIAFVRKPPRGPGSLGMVEVATGRELNLSGNPLDNLAHPAWSPDGTRLAFVQNGYPALMLADGKGVRVLSEQLGSGEAPRWSPDDAWLAFAPPGHNRESRVYVVRRDGSELRAVTPAGLGAEQPCWSPDGARLAFVALPAEAQLWQGVGVGAGWVIWLCYAVFGPLALLSAQRARQVRGGGVVAGVGLAGGLLALTLYAMSLVYLTLTLVAAGP